MIRSVFSISAVVTKGEKGFLSSSHLLSQFMHPCSWGHGALYYVDSHCGMNGTQATTEHVPKRLKGELVGIQTFCSMEKSPRISGSCWKLRSLGGKKEIVKLYTEREF